MAYMDVEMADGIIAPRPLIRLWKDVYNFGNQFRYTIKEIAEIVAEVSKKYTDNPVKIEIEKRCSSGYWNGFDAVLY